MTRVPAAVDLQQSNERFPRSGELHRFVREQRMQLAPESHCLGEFPRLPNRIGKRVTQEEVAEYLGISRGWYARFEAGSAAGFSVSLLRRLGDVLLLSEADRVELARLAMPDLVPVVAGDSTKLRETLAVVRRAVKRLWTATSEAEILYVAGEEARQLVPGFELIFSRRIGALEEAQFPRSGENSTARLAEARAYAFRRLAPERFAQLDALWQCIPAGAVGHRAGGLGGKVVLSSGAPLSSDVYSLESLRRYHRALHEYRLALHEQSVNWDSVVAAHIRGSNGSALVGGASTCPHDVTELDRAMLSAIADFASLALQ
jgi:transcriptional regulator with XRE-family HTH domain